MMLVLLVEFADEPKVSDLLICKAAVVFEEKIFTLLPVLGSSKIVPLPLPPVVQV